MHIQIDDLQQPDIALLLADHHEDMLLHSPPSNVHTLDLSALRGLDVTFWTARIKGELAGCGALKELDQSHGEIKSMRTSTQHLKQGVGASILQRILSEASSRAYSRLSLETGPSEVFGPAIRLYQRFGFNECAPFSDYKESPYSLFMTLEL